MSRIIDGRDLLKRYARPSITVAEYLEGEEVEIPLGAIASVKHLFSRANDYIREKDGEEPINKDWRAVREFGVAYQMVTDMLRRAIPTNDEEIDERIKKLASTLEGIAIKREQVQPIMEQPPEIRDLAKLLRGIYTERTKYGYPQSHSKYSVGTFDDDD